jgi:recombinational DNA repair ATPase RecF
MILAATDVAQGELGQQVLMLLDDPAAELDSGSLERLMRRVIALGSQVIATSLDRQADLFPQQPAVFHVEQGVLTKTA